MFRLNPFDDYPFHQAVTPVDIPFTSDPHFNDGYWWSWYTVGVYFFVGLRLHPNNNVMDGYAGVVHGDVQRNVRVSRALRPNTNELVVGPLRVDIVEPMVRQRLRLTGNDQGVGFDVEATASAPMFVEAPHVQYRHGRLFNHLVRFSGPTRVTGTATLDGGELRIDQWFGARDHSWGIRSTMGPHVPIRGTEPEPSEQDRRAIRMWVPFETDKEQGFFHLHEDADGRVLDLEGIVHHADGSSSRVTAVDHRFEYHPGTRRLARGGFTLTLDRGDKADYAFEVVGPPAHPQGFGYTRGWSDGDHPGVYRGAEYMETDRFDVSDPGGRAGPDHILVERRLGGTEFAASVHGSDGSVGMAHIEHMIYGRYAPYGFEEIHR
ncbi:MAG: hypothetical protein ACRD29_14095 [Acidimicrobiales bacterium]